MRALYFFNGFVSMLVIGALLAATALAAPAYAADPAPQIRGDVVYDANGGIGGETVLDVADGSKLAFPKVSRTGYSLTGWYTAKSGGVKVASSATVVFSGNGAVFRLYAQWAAKKMMLKYKLDKGKLPADTPKYKEVVFDSFYGKLPVPSRSGHKFLGWYIAGAKISAITKVTKTGAHTITAKWLKKGSGRTITTTEYKRLKTGMSPADAKYTVGGVLYSDKEKIKGHTYTIHTWGSASSASKGAIALFKDGELIQKATGKHKTLLNKLNDWFMNEYYD